MSSPWPQGTRRQAPLPLALLAVGLLGGCGGGDTVVLVQVDARPVLPSVDTLRVTIHAGAEDFQRDLTALPAVTFPTTFTITANGRDGPVTVEVVGLVDDELRARGVGEALLSGGGRTDVGVLLEPTDFLVNVQVARDQVPSVRIAGRQVAADPTGNVVIVWEDLCANPVDCDIYARLLDQNGVPRLNSLSLSDGEFNVDVGSADQEHTTPAVSTFADGSIVVVWKSISARQILAQRLDINGAPLGAQISVSDLDQAVSDPDVATLSGGAFVATWTQNTVTTGAGINEIHYRTFDATGTGGTEKLASFSGGKQLQSPSVVAAPAGAGFLIAWIELVSPRITGLVEARPFDEAGVALSAMEAAVSSTATGLSDNPDTAALPDGGFVVVWQDGAETDTPVLPDVDGTVLVRRLGPDGAPLGEDAIVNAAPAGIQALAAVAAAPAGGFTVAWTDCGVADGQACGVLGRAFLTTGLPVGNDFVINTTTASDQARPSLAAGALDSVIAVYEDRSEAPPDVDGSGVRARLVFPTLERADGVVGARCDTTPCGVGLVCVLGTDQARRCVPPCDPAAAPPLCPGGGVCQAGAADDAALDACVF